MVEVILAPRLSLPTNHCGCRFTKIEIAKWSRQDEQEMRSCSALRARQEMRACSDDPALGKQART